MDRVDSRNIGVPRLVPLAVQEGEDMVGTHRADYIPSAGAQCTEVDHTTPVEARIAMHKRRMEKQPESCENSLRC